MDSLEDMEMDDAVHPATNMAPPHHQQHFGGGGHPSMMAPLNTGMANTMTAQHAFRSSAPTTPATPHAFAMFSNPTVSSVKHSGAQHAITAAWPADFTGIVYPRYASGNGPKFRGGQLHGRIAPQE